MSHGWNALETLARDAAALAPVLVGVPEANPSDEGRPLFNSAALLRGGRVEQRFRKALLPTYDVFDEDRYFEPSTARSCSTSPARRVGISICEDIWNDRDFWKRRRYHHDPIDELAAGRRDVVVNMSASPFTAGKHQRARGDARQHGAEAPPADRLRQPVRRQRRSGLRRPQHGVRRRRRRRRARPLVRRRRRGLRICGAAADRAGRRSRRRVRDLARARARHARLRRANAGSAASCSGCPAASTRRSPRRSPSRRSAPIACSAC